MSTKCHQKCPKNAMSLMFKKKKHSLGLMLNSWFSLFLTDNLTPKLIIVCMWKITDVYFLAQSARKKNSNSDHNRDHRKENPSNHRNLWRKKVKSQTNLCETLTHLLPFKETKSQKNIRYMGTISLIYSPTWGLMVKIFIFHHIQAY